MVPFKRILRLPRIARLRTNRSGSWLEIALGGRCRPLGAETLKNDDLGCAFTAVGVPRLKPHGMVGVAESHDSMWL